MKLTPQEEADRLVSEHLWKQRHYDIAKRIVAIESAIQDVQNTIYVLKRQIEDEDISYFNVVNYYIQSEITYQNEVLTILKSKLK